MEIDLFNKLRRLTNEVGYQLGHVIRYGNTVESNGAFEATRALREAWRVLNDKCDENQDGADVGKIDYKKIEQDVYGIGQLLLKSVNGNVQLREEVTQFVTFLERQKQVPMTLKQFQEASRQKIDRRAISRSTSQSLPGTQRRTVRGYGL